MEHMVIKDATRPTPRGLRMYSRSRSRYPPVDLLSKRSEVADDTGKIMGEVPGLLGQACGGDDLSKCTWETTMKKLILSFP